MVNRSEAIKREYQESQQRGRSAYTYVKVEELDRMGIEQYKPASGDNFIAIVCNPKQQGFFGKKVVIHNNIGVDGKVYVCPKGTYGDPCPICEEVARMKKSGEDQELIDELRPSTRYLFFVIDMKSRSTEEKGVQWFDASSGIKDEIVSLSHNKRTGDAIDISDPVDGKTVSFNRTGARLKTRYKGFELEDREYPIDEDILEDIPLFENVIQSVTYEQLEEAFKGTSSSRRRREEEEDEDRSSRRRSREEEDEDRSSRRRNRDEEDEDRSSRRRSRDEEDEDRSSRRRSRDEGEEDEDRSSRRRSRDEGEEDLKNRRREDETNVSKDENGVKDNSDTSLKKETFDEEPKEEEESLSDRVRNRRRRREEEQNAR